MRKILALIILIVLLTVTFVNGYSAEIDGIDDGYEWDGAASCVMVDGESNCGVDFAIMKTLLDNENRAVYFCFMWKDPDLETDNLMTGISLSVNDSERFVFTSDLSPVDYDAYKFSFEGAVSIDKNNGATCEVRIGFKEGLPKRIYGTVRFIDAAGMPSNEYDFSLINEEYTERTALVINSYDNNGSDEPKNKTTTKNQKTEETNSGDYTTHDIEISTSPPYSYVRTTKVKNTTLKSTTESSTVTETVLSKNEPSSKSTTVRNIKNNLSSTKNKSQNKDNKPVTTAYDEKISDVKTSVISSNTESESLVSEASKTDVTQGTKYKYTVGAVSATVLVLLAAWSAKSGKIKADTENNDD